jgi:hypothetical protein
MSNYSAKDSGSRKSGGMEKTKEKVAQVFNQAKESLKILETLEKETLAKARSFVKIPTSAERRRLTNDRILNSLKKLGVATRSEVDTLEERIQKLESALNSRKEPNKEHRSTTRSADTH